jgi:hypothetical protein
VPDEAVFAEGNQSFVFIVKPDSTVARHAIVLGTRDSARAEVTRGLKAGDRVVRAGYQKLFEGARVMPVPADGFGGPGRPGAQASAPGAAGGGGANPAAAGKGGAVAPAPRRGGR